MNLTFPVLTAGMLLSSALFITGCASDPIDTSVDRNEEYNREFIKAFGVPSANHNWSDAEKTTLTIKSTYGADVRVYYESEGQLFLTGDLTVASGSQQIPFIIPDGITTLKVEANGRQYDVCVGSTLDLDHTTPSRAFGTSAEYDSKNQAWEIEYATDENTQRECHIRFTRDGLAKAFFDAFPLGESNISVSGAKYMCQIYSSNKSNPENESYYIYPIFWSNKSGLNSTITKNYDYQFGVYKFDNSVWFDDQTRPNIIEPDRSFSLMSFHIIDNLSSGQTAYDGLSDFSATTTKHTTFSSVHLNHMPQSYSLDGDNITIQTQGIKIKSGGFYPALKFGTDDNITSAERNRLTWRNRYWNLYLNQYRYNDGYSGVAFYTPKDKVKFKVWRKQADGKYAWEERERTGYFIGFSAPPKENVKNGYNYGDDTPCDFCDAVFFVTPEDANTEIRLSSSSASFTTNSGPFLIAAEDLGGSFDWDFNDAVFQVSCVTRNSSDIAEDILNSRWAEFPSYYDLKLPYVYQIEVTPLAAGGTMPIYVAYHGKVSKYTEPVENIDPATTKYNDIIDKVAEFQKNLTFEDGTWIVGTELHKWLGASDTNTAINVGEKVTHTGRSVKFYVDTELKASTTTSKQNVPLMRFSVIVDRDNSLGIDTSANFDPNGTDTYSPGVTKFNGVLGQGTYQISPVSEDDNLISPQMFCIGNSGWLWPQEMHSINLAYPQFAGWVEDETKNTSWDWYGNAEHTVKRK